MPALVMDPVDIVGSYVVAGKEVRTSSGFAIGTWFIPYTVVAGGVAAAIAIGLVVSMTGKRRRTKRRR